jgi:hypothetical protein
MFHTACCLVHFIRDISLIRFAKKKPATVLVAGFTIRSLKPVVTTLGRQFIASTSFKTNSWGEHSALNVPDV